MNAPTLTLRSIRAVGVEVPMKFPLGTSQATIRVAPLLLIEIAPAELWGKIARRFTLIGVQGIVRMAMAGFDVACWDALAKAAGKPLVSCSAAHRARFARTTATAWG